MIPCVRRPHSVWTTCVCEDCTKDRRRKRKLHHAGLYNRIPSEKAWEVIDRLTALGWSGQAIASAAGLHPNTIQAVMYKDAGKKRQFGAVITRKIVNHGDPTAGYVGNIGTRRRLQGLARQQYDLETLSQMTGIKFSTLAAIRQGPSKRVRADLYVTIRDFTREIGVKLGPSKEAKRHAEKRRWVPLMAWHAGSIDEPNAEPDGMVRPAPGSKQWKPVAQCGEDRAYQKHKRDGTPICDPCRRAHRDANRLRKARMKAKEDAA